MHQLTHRLALVAVAAGLAGVSGCRTTSPSSSSRDALATGVPAPESCVPVNSLRCPKGQHPGPGDCKSPRFVGAPTFGKCLADSLGNGSTSSLDAAAPATVSDPCVTAINKGAQSQWQLDGGTDKNPAVTVAPSADGKGYLCSISGDETGEFDYYVTVARAAGACQLVKWNQDNS